MGTPSPSESLRIQIRSVLTVKASAENQRNEIVELSKSDTRTIPGHLPVLYIFPAAENVTKAVCQSEILRESLTLALGIFYPLAGRIKYLRDAESNSKLVIECCNKGIPFTEASANIPLSMAVPDIKQPSSLPPGLTSAPPPSLLVNVKDPMLTVQLTTFPCGGTILSVSFHHMCTDGKGFFHFMHVWGCLARGQPFVRPVHNRSVYIQQMKERQGKDATNHKGIGYKAVRVVKAAMYLLDLVFQSLWEPSLTSLRIHLSASQLRRLKGTAASNWEAVSCCDPGEQAELRVTFPCDDVEYVSTDDVVCATLWQAITRARGLKEKPSTAVTFRRAVDTRSRIQPPLPDEYFGNAVLGDNPHHFAVPAGKLLRTPVPLIARFMRQSIQRVDNDYCKRFWAMEEPSTALGAILPPRVGRGVIITSWSKFDMYSLDFGFGRPEFVCVSYGEKPRFASGAVVIQAGSEGEGGLDVILVLPRKVLENVVADPILVSL